MVQNHISECIMLDSDVCSFVDYSTLDFEKYDAAASCMYYRDNTKWMVVPHVTYWRIEKLQNFTDYLVEQYQNNSKRLIDKRNELIQNKASYGISDMSLLYLWVTECCDNFWNLAIARNQETFDVFFNSKVNCDGVPFKMVNGIKKVVFKDKVPYFITEDNEWIKANAIHAQGDRKKYIHMISKRKYNIILLRWADFQFYVKKTVERGKRFLHRYL